MLDSMVNRWFAVQVRPQYEKMVAFLLRGKNYEDFLPQYKTQVSSGSGGRFRERPLFPGYVFCRVTPSAQGRIVTTPGVIRIVGVGTQPVPVDEQEIESLRAVIRSGRPIQPCPNLSKGDWVELTQGPLRGCRGILERWKNERRLIISISLLQRAVAVELDFDCVQPAPAYWQAPIPGTRVRVRSAAD